MCAVNFRAGNFFCAVENFFANIFQRPFDNRNRHCHRRRQKSRHAGAGQKFRHAVERVRRFVHRITAGATVNVNVDKSRRDVKIFRVDNFFRVRVVTDCGNFFVERQRNVGADKKITGVVRQNKFSVYNFFHGKHFLLSEIKRRGQKNLPAFAKN